MKLKKFFNTYTTDLSESKKIIFKVFLIFLSLSFVILNICIFLYYQQYKKINLERNNALIQKQALQGERLFSVYNHSIVIQAMQLLNSPNNKKLLHEKQVDQTTYINTMRELSSFVSSSNWLYSAYLINGNSDFVYSSDENMPSDYLQNFTDKYCLEAVKSTRLNLNTAYIRSMQYNSSKRKLYLLSYIVKNGDSFLIINCDLHPLINILSLSNKELIINYDDGKNIKDEKFLFIKDDMILNVDESRKILTPDLIKKIRALKSKNITQNSSKIDDKISDYKKYQIIYSDIKENNIQLFYLISHDNYLEYLNNLAVFNLIFIILICFSFFSFNLFLYKYIILPFNKSWQLLIKQNPNITQSQGLLQAVDKLMLKNQLEELLGKQHISTYKHEYFGFQNDLLFLSALNKSNTKIKIYQKKINLICRNFAKKHESICKTHIRYHEDENFIVFFIQLQINNKINNKTNTSSYPSKAEIYLIYINFYEAILQINKNFLHDIKNSSEQDFIAFALSKNFQDIAEIYTLIQESFKLRLINKDCMGNVYKIKKLQNTCEFDSKALINLLYLNSTDEIKKGLENYFTNLKKLRFTPLCLYLRNSILQLQTLLNENKGQLDITNDETILKLPDTAQLFSYIYNQLEILFQEKISKRNKHHKEICIKIKELINLHLNDTNLSNKLLADKLSLSTTYINKLFKEDQNISISHYINEQRLILAADLLRESDINIKDICCQLGISNMNYFYTLFKNYYHKTPIEYRKYYQEQENIKI